jgi:hypothetical protein
MELIRLEAAKSPNLVWRIRSNLGQGNNLKVAIAPQRETPLRVALVQVKTDAYERLVYSPKSSGLVSAAIEPAINELARMGEKPIDLILFPEPSVISGTSVLQGGVFRDQSAICSEVSSVAKNLGLTIGIGYLTRRKDGVQSQWNTVHYDYFDPSGQTIGQCIKGELERRGILLGDTLWRTLICCEAYSIAVDEYRSQFSGDKLDGVCLPSATGNFSVDMFMRIIFDRLGQRLPILNSNLLCGRFAQSHVFHPDYAVPGAHLVRLELEEGISVFDL